MDILKNAVSYLHHFILVQDNKKLYIMSYINISIWIKITNGYLNGITMNSKA